MMSTVSDRKTLTVALVGNPNTGKSTLFGALSGTPQRVGNYPGVTVEKKLGKVIDGVHEWTLVDLPGTYSLAPRSPDEMVAVDVLLGRMADVPSLDVILCVVAANNLERNLYLVSQILEIGRPVVIALTMNDIAERQGLNIDAQRLTQQLGVPVVSIQAPQGVGLDQLKSTVTVTAFAPPPVVESPFPPEFAGEVQRLGTLLSETIPAGSTANGQAERFPRYLVERLLLDSGGYIEERFCRDGDQAVIRRALDESRGRLAEAGFQVPAVETSSRYGWISRVTQGVIDQPVEIKTTWGDRIDAVLTHRVWGLVFFALVMLFTFSAVFSWATYPMDGIEALVGGASELVEGVMPEGTLRSLVVDGIIGGIGAVIIFLPQIFILFFILTSLEECGYLSRAAYLMDQVMVKVGLSGKSFIPMLSSFACAIPGVMATRVIEDRRDRITTIMIAPLMSCSARLPVYTLMIAAFIPSRTYLGGLLGLQGLTLFAMYMVGVVVAAIVAFFLKRTILKGGAPPFLMEMPAYKWPSLGVVIRRMLERGWDFLYNAGTIIFAVSIVMWAALYYPRISPEQIAPLTAEQTRLEALRDDARARDDSETAASLNEEIAVVENRIQGAQQRQSILGRLGRLIEPVVKPLGWDWRIGSGVIASFPAREVVVATMGVIFDVGDEVDEGEGSQRLIDAMQAATWHDSGKPLFNIPVALSVMVFFALCAQCVSTLAVIGRETQSWTWPLGSFLYMTIIAYIAAFFTYQIGMWVIG